MSVFFNGRLITTPTVESAIYDSAMAAAWPGKSDNVVAILGTSEGGLPKRLMYFDSPVIARRRLRSGALLKAVEMAFNPSAETGSPGRVAVVRIEEAVQAQLMLEGDLGLDVVLLKSSDHGAHTNSIKVTVESGTSAGKRLTVQSDEYYFSENNVSRAPLSVRYSGAEATATVTVSAAQLTLAAGGSVVLTLANYATIRELADAINAQPGWSAIALVPADKVNLDGVVAGNAKASDLILKADLQATVDWFNTVARELVTAERVAGALKPPVNLTGTYMSGGSNGPAPTTDDWQDAFDAMQAGDIQWVVPLSSEPTVWDMADAHVQFMSGPGKSERRAFVGGEVVTGTLTEAMDATRAAAVSLNSDRTALCFPCPLEYQESGELKPIPSYFLAARIAGGFAAMGFGNTMTNKVLSIDGIDPLLANVYDSDLLINSGVLCVRQTQRGYVVSKAVTTWLANNNYNRVEISTGAALDFVARTVRDALEKFVGRKGSPITIHEAISATDSVLRELSRPEPVGQGVIVGSVDSPAYRGVTAEIDGDILRVWFECSPVVPVNYVLVGIHSQIFQGRVSSVVTNG